MGPSCADESVGRLVEPPLQPKYRPEDDEIPDGMRLLYADLRRRPEPPAHDRARIDLLICGVVAAAGVAVVGSRVVGDLVRGPGPDRVAGATEAPFEGVERSSFAPAVGVRDTPPLVTLPQVAPAPEIEYSPPAEPAPGGSGDMAVAEPAPLPGPGVGSRPVTPPRPPSPVPEAEPPEPIPAPGPVEAEPGEEAPPATLSTVPVTTTTTGPETTSTTVPTTTTTVPLGEMKSFAAPLGFLTTPGMSAVVAAIGVGGWIEAQLDPETVPDPVVDEALAGFDLMDGDAVDLRARGLAEVALSQSRWAGFTRGFVGERQVKEALVVLWREFFAVRGDAADELAHDQAIRRHGLGRFDDLLVEMVKSPAQLRSTGGTRVDGSSPGPHPSGLARVVLERLTVGSGVASEAEVIAVTEVLSGWTVDGAGRFVFDDGRHARSPAHVLGWDTPGRSGSAGFDDGRNLLGHLARRAETADRVAALIAKRFLGEGASRGLIERAAGAYLVADTSVAAVIRVVLADAARGAGGTARRGREWMTAALRALRVTADISGPWDGGIIDSVPALLRSVGDEPGAETARVGRDPGLWWESPTAISRRWAVARRLTGPAAGSGLSIDVGWLRPAEPTTADQFVDGLAERLDVHLTDREHNALLAYLGLDGDDQVFDDTVDDSALADLAALVVSFPSFMRRDGGVS